MRNWLQDVWQWNLNWIRPFRARESLMVYGPMSNLNLARIHWKNKDKLVWEWRKDGEYIVNSCMLAHDKRRLVGTKPYDIHYTIKQVYRRIRSVNVTHELSVKKLPTVSPMKSISQNLDLQ